MEICSEVRTLEDLARGVRLVDTGEYPHLPYEKQDQWQRNARGYRLRLEYKGRKYSFDFWQGTGCKSEPTAAGCLECLLSASSAADEDFEGFCASFDYDTDSRKAYSTWLACRRIARNMQRLLGDDFNLFLDADR